jgi:hypothetical protein
VSITVGKETLGNFFLINMQNWVHINTHVYDGRIA